MAGHILSAMHKGATLDDIIAEVRSLYELAEEWHQSHANQTPPSREGGRPTPAARAARAPVRRSPRTGGGPPSPRTGR